MITSCADKSDKLTVKQSPEKDEPEQGILGGLDELPPPIGKILAGMTATPEK